MAEDAQRDEDGLGADHRASEDQTLAAERRAQVGGAHGGVHYV